MAAFALSACEQAADDGGTQGSSTKLSKRSCGLISNKPVRVEGGTFAMGQTEVYREEGPIRETTVSGFWIDPYEVTNRQFEEFVAATQHVSVAEMPVDPAQFGVPIERIPPAMLQPGSAVFKTPDQLSSNNSDGWQYIPGANWKKPYGPSGPNAALNEPVVHLAWEDMAAYADWRGGRIPTEAEWEFAAGAGQKKSVEQPADDQANTWQGVFPVLNEASDAFAGIAPVGCFEPNPLGLYDMVGNVWEITADFYQAGHDPKDRLNPRGPSENAVYDPRNPDLLNRVMKGGSYLCASNYCQRYRPESRQGNDPGLGAINVGFRLVYDQEPGRTP
ncbi:MAG: formylglycine-generating enzyme family protein [Erythrobacter sp.]